MDVYQEYKRKCCTADQAVQVVKDGDWVDYGMSCAYPTALDKALARRQGDLKDIKAVSYTHLTLPTIRLV